MERLKTLKAHLTKSSTINKHTNASNRGLRRSMSTNKKDSVKIEEIGPLTKIQLNRPEKLNSLNLDMVRYLSPVYSKLLDKSSTVSCVVMTGSGDKAFCAGGDVAAIQQELVAGKSLESGSICTDFFYEEYTLNQKIASLYSQRGITQVSIWDGIVMGGGVGLSVHGEIRVCTEKSMFAMPETGIGLFPDVGGTHVLSRLKPNFAMGLYIALCGNRLKKDDLLYTGLATHYISSDNVEVFNTKLEELAKQNRKKQLTKERIEALILDIQPDQSFNKDSSVLYANEEQITHCFSQHNVLDIFLEVSKLAEGANAWAAKTQKELSRMSPTSLKVTFEAIKRHSGDVTLKQAFRNEYRLSQRFMRLQPHSDFAEGIRAVLIDKDLKPQWQPASLNEVSQESVEAFFDPLEDNHPRGELSL